jgi:hypothetical protein
MADKSWREIDRNKDKSNHRSSRSSGGGRKQNKRTSSYKKNLDKLFEPDADVPDELQDLVKEIEPEEGTEEAERKKAIAALREVEGFKAFTETVEWYLEEGFALPDNENLLLRILDHPNEKVVQTVLEHLLDLGSRRKLKRVAPLQNRLSTIRTMASRPGTETLLDDVQSMLDNMEG